MFRWLRRLGLVGVIGGVGAGALLVSSPFYVYDVLTEERLAGSIRFQQVGPRTYLAELVAADGLCVAEHYEVIGDEFRLDAQFVKWEDWAQLVGADPLYRLERLSGRYASEDAERVAPRSAVQLGDDALFNPFQYADGGFGVDTVYGSSVYAEMHEGASYDVLVSSSGLFLREQQLDDTVRIDRGCGRQPGWWERIVVQLNE